MNSISEVDMKNGITEAARTLRNNPTEAEDILWRHIRNKQLGKKFLRQKPIIFALNNQKRFIVADFFCKEAKVIIELDGYIHDARKEYDDSRDKIVKLYGYRVIRFTNDEVYENIDEVITKILIAINYKQ